MRPDDLVRKMRPLGSVQSEREHLYQISRIIEGVSACLVDMSLRPEPADYFCVMELSGRLDFAVDSMRQMNGATQ